MLNLYIKQYSSYTSVKDYMRNTYSGGVLFFQFEDNKISRHSYRKGGCFFVTLKVGSAHDYLDQPHDYNSADESDG
ncbi:hypothetical protein SAMN02745691_00862 [Parasporobacterium paucivorans DSM 15970]|uniref:Uncharacterized protein n=1 Tax=Parasporobacterium paucivorans DSM 15970 TaxID=1122934 RepID=A0A1M6E5C8_9FIRM|nr:hypothetical protein SAMN02745691_00862 [Parasporobacterium paucivorans DSM 15970]